MKSNELKVDNSLLTGESAGKYSTPTIFHSSFCRWLLLSAITLVFLAKEEAGNKIDLTMSVNQTDCWRCLGVWSDQGRMLRDVKGHRQ